MMHILQELCRAGGARNEDHIFYGPDYVVLLDGATSLMPTRRDAVWFTRLFRTLFEPALEAEGSLAGAINRAIRQMEEEHLDTIHRNRPEYYPSAAGVFVYRKGDTLCLYAIGDCTAVLHYRDGRVERIRKTDVDEFDAQVLDEMKRLQVQTGITPARAVEWEEIRARLVANRKKMNRPDGYKILSMNMEPVKQAEVLRIPADQVDRVLLFSDGFDWVEGSLSGPDPDLERAYEQLRALEEADPDFTQYPRFKLHDDASAVLFGVE